MSTARPATQHAAKAEPVAEPTPTSEAPEETASEAPPQPTRQEDELRCTLCGLRACWTS